MSLCELGKAVLHVKSEGDLNSGHVLEQLIPMHYPHGLSFCFTTFSDLGRLAELQVCLVFFCFLNPVYSHKSRSSKF